MTKHILFGTQISFWGMNRTLDGRMGHWVRGAGLRPSHWKAYALALLPESCAFKATGSSGRLEKGLMGRPQMHHLPERPAPWWLGPAAELLTGEATLNSVLLSSRSWLSLHSRCFWDGHLMMPLTMYISSNMVLDSLMFVKMVVLWHWIMRNTSIAAATSPAQCTGATTTKHIFKF